MTNFADMPGAVVVWYRADICQYCRGCLVCATRKGSRKAFKPPLTPIPVGGHFIMWQWIFFSLSDVNLLSIQCCQVAV